MKRKIYNKLKDWKEKDRGKCAILIDGARRVGKSYIAEEFAKNEYKSYILIDFATVEEDVKKFFEHAASDLDLFFQELSSYYRTELYNRESLFIFDEVQRYPLARQLIKYLVKDGRYDYIETGSLITLRKNVEKIVIPSEEEHIELFPMDFEEFLWAMGDTVTFPFVKERFDSLKPLGPALHKKILSYYRQYMLVGGMPQVIEEYAKSKDFEAIDRIKKRILTLYREDITKFAKGYKDKVLAVFDELPSQLSKIEKKYKISDLKQGSQFRTYESAFLWLSEAMVINNCHNATDPSVGLSMSRDHSTRKYYMADTGLLVTHSFMDKNFVNNELYRSVLLDKIHVNEGMLTENIVSQELRASGHKLFFYSRSDSQNRENNLEIDFLISRENKISPVEVKSGNYRTHSSLDKFRKKYGKKLGKAYIVYSKDVMLKDNVIHLPIYMAGLL